jgi:hypothetical protein
VWPRSRDVSTDHDDLLVQAGKLISLIAVGVAAIVAAGSHWIVAVSFTVLTSASQKVIIDEASGTRYQKGTGSASASAIAAGKPVPALGTTEAARRDTQPFAQPLRWLTEG